MEKKNKKQDKSGKPSGKSEADKKVDPSLSEEEKETRLLILLKTKKFDKSEDALAKALNTSIQDMLNIAEKLNVKGFNIHVIDKKGNGKDTKRELTLCTASDSDESEEAIPIAVANKKFKIAFLSEIRMGSKQAQISLLHWLYNVVFPKEDIDFVVVIGGLVMGKPTATTEPDALLTDAEEMVNYAVECFPRSKKFKTYIVSGRGELSWRVKDGIDIVSAICNKRDDLRKAGELEKSFDVKGIRIKTMSAWDDNSPKAVSYGPQKIANALKDDLKPTLLVFGGLHRRSRLPKYNGMFIETVPSLHKRMMRQGRRGVEPRIGYTIAELTFGDNWSFDPSLGLKVYLNALDQYAVSNDVYDINVSKAANLDDVSKQVLGWFVKEHIISAGDLSRRLKMGKEGVAAIIKKLASCGIKIPFKDDTKRYELQVSVKLKFAPPPLKYEDVYIFATKEASVSDNHSGSKKELPAIFKQAYQDAASAGVRRMYHPGDVTDGPAASGYRGHQFDVIDSDLDGMENRAVANWPQVKIKVDPKKPIMVTEMVNNTDGTISYPTKMEKSQKEVWLQTDVIEGNHDAWAWKSIGHLIVRMLAIRLPHLLRYLGSMYGSVVVDGIYHKLIHPDGGMGYSLSPQVEKHLKLIRESGESGGLPAIAYLGHFHSSFMLFDERVGILVPCLKAPDEFLETHAMLPSMGMFINEVFTDKEGKKITRIISEYRDYFPMYLKSKKDQAKF